MTQLKKIETGLNQDLKSHPSIIGSCSGDCGTDLDVIGLCLDS